MLVARALAPRVKAAESNHAASRCAVLPGRPPLPRPLPALPYPSWLARHAQYRREATDAASTGRSHGLPTRAPGRDGIDSPIRSASSTGFAADIGADNAAARRRHRDTARSIAV